MHASNPQNSGDLRGQGQPRPLSKTLSPKKFRGEEHEGCKGKGRRKELGEVGEGESEENGDGDESQDGQFTD